jgi:hypothetical protein
VVSTNKPALAIFAALLLIVAIAVIFATRGCRDESAEPSAPLQMTEPSPTPEPTPSLQDRLSARLKGITLGTSDTVIRELVAALSDRPEIGAWLVNEDLVRRFVASVNNIAEGKDPRQHLEFLRPETSFRAAERNGRIVVDPDSYRRYDTVTKVFTSLDSEGTAALLAELKPLIDDAYAEIASPGSRFEDRLQAAIDELLEVPIPTDEVELQPRVLTFAYADEDLERLSPAQRQLLRMGPDNMRAIQAKLRELRSAIQ